MRLTWILALLVFSSSIALCASVDRDGSAVETLLARAESAVAQAEDTQNPDERLALYDEAIAAYRGVIDAGAQNAAVYRNIGTVRVLKGDLGRAIVSFRRADRLDPTDRRVADSLQAARAMVRSEVSPGVRTRVWDAAFFWRGLVPRRAMLWIGIGGWAVLWIGAGLRLVGMRAGVFWAILGGFVCVVVIGSLVGERALVSMNPAGVVVDDGVVGYRGPSGSVYDATFEEPIRAGVEGAIVERRDGWVRLRLRSGAETWVRASSIEQV